MPRGQVNTFLEKRFGLDQWVSMGGHESLGKGRLAL